MKICKSVIIVSVVSIIVSGCSYTNNKNKYQNAKATDPLILPKGLSKVNYKDTFNIPEIPDDGNFEKVSDVPPLM